MHAHLEIEVTNPEMSENVQNEVWAEKVMRNETHPVAQLDEFRFADFRKLFQ